MEVAEVLKCHACGREIGDILLPGVIVQMPLFEGEKEKAWHNNFCFRRDKLQ